MELIIWIVGIWLAWMAIAWIIDAIQASNRDEKVKNAFNKSTITTYNFNSEMQEIKGFVNSIDEAGVGNSILEIESKNKERDQSLKYFDTHRRCKVCRKKLKLRVEIKTGVEYLECINNPRCNYTERYVR